MKHKFSLILFTALLSTTFAWAQTTSSAYYEVPAGAFFAGMTDNSSAADKTFYLPYNLGQEYTFTSTEAGTWTLEGEAADETNKNYSYKSCEMKGSYHIPFLTVGETGYQYGASGKSYDANLYFHVGNSEMHNMTPARLYGADGKLTNYLRSEYNVSTHSTIGVYFDNKDVMYIDGISIPVKNSASGATEASLFSTGSKITVNIYEAPGIVARSTDNKSKRSSTCKKTIELKSNNYQKYSDDQTQRGALSTTFDPIVITGPFVVELINDGCVFTVYSSTEKENKWGYYIDNEEEKYPATYTPLISVHAMFPALYTKESQEVTVPSTGSTFGDADCPTRTVYANCKYEKNKNGWSRTASKSNVITMDFYKDDQTDVSTKWYFIMSKNTTTEERTVDVTFTFRDKELTYHVTQAPKLQSISLSEEAISLKVGDEYNNLTATLSPATTDQTEITWSSSDNNIATVDADGKVTAVTLGEATIKATSKADNNIYAECTVTVTPKVETHNVPKSNLIAPSTAEGNVQFTNDNTNYYKQIQYKITGKNFVDADWTVTFSEGCDWVEYKFLHDQNYPNRAIITLKTKESNQTESNRSGNVTIKAYGYEFNYSISQAPMINKIDGWPGLILLKVGAEQDNLSPSVSPTNTDQDQTINVESSNADVATITKDEQTGKYKITAVGAGTATITATSDANENVKAECTVTVYEVKPEVPTATTLEAKPAGGETTVAFTLSGATFNEANWSVTEKPDWITSANFTSSQTAPEGPTTVTCTLTADANATLNKRSGTIKIQVFGEKYEFEYTITQEPMPSAFYNLPEGAFGCGMTTTGVLADPYIVAPYFPDKSPVWTSTTGAGKWTVNSETVANNAETYEMSVSMKGEYNIPMLEQEGMRKFQFGIQNDEKYRTEPKFRVGDPTPRYITPALMFTDLASKSSGQAHALISNYNTETNDVMGVYFNNIGVMYIDGISIPIKNSSADNADDMFPTDNAHVIVNIYKATTSISGKDGNEADKDNPLWTGKLTIAQYSDETSNTGALNVTFGQDGFQDPIFIDGPFVVELSDMNTSGCKFGVYSSQVHSGANKWGYYLKGGQETYPGNYTLAISVHAMFPALYPNDDEDLNIKFPAEGKKIERTVFANCKYEEGSDWNLSVPEGIGLSVVPVSKDEDETTLSFTMTANTTTAVREGDVTFTFRGKELKYHLIQVPAPYTRTVTSGKWGTICLPYAAESFTGAEMYSIAGKTEGETGIYLDQVSTMEAGVPYIFKATADEIKVVYAAGEAQEAQTVNGLCGYIGKEDLTVPTDGNSYIVYQNALYLVDSEVKIASNRAYIHYDNELGTPSTAPQIRRVAMPISGAPTSLLQVNDTKPAVKILRDGHIVILRDNKEYNILGQSK